MLGYAGAFYLMALVLKTIPLSLTDAIWSGVGTAGTALIGVLLFKEALDLPRVAGLILVVLGVVLLDLGRS